MYKKIGGEDLVISRSTVSIPSPTPRVPSSPPVRSRLLVDPVSDIGRFGSTLPWRLLSLSPLRPLRSKASSGLSIFFFGELLGLFSHLCSFGSGCGFGLDFSPGLEDGFPGSGVLSHLVLVPFPGDQPSSDKTMSKLKGKRVMEHVPGVNSVTIGVEEPFFGNGFGCDGRSVVELAKGLGRSLFVPVRPLLIVRALLVMTLIVRPLLVWAVVRETSPG